jgi:hypothetical protein
MSSFYPSFTFFLLMQAMASSLLDPRLAAIALVMLLASVSLFRKKRPTPPGPPGLPVLGNLFDIPKKESWKVYLDWGKQYSMFLTYPNQFFFAEQIYRQ